MKKNKLMTVFLSTGICFLTNSPSQAGKIEISQDNLFVPHMVAKQARLSYDTDKNEFTAVIDGKQKKINNYDVSGLPSNISENQIENFLKVGYFSLHQADEDLILYTNVRGLGGSGSNKKAAAGATAGGVAGAYTGAAFGFGLGGPPGAVVGGIAGGAIGATGVGMIGHAADKRDAAKPPPKPVSQPAPKKAPNCNCGVGHR